MRQIAINVTIYAVINGKTHQETMSLDDLLEWHPIEWYPEGISKAEFLSLPKLVQFELLKECSEAYWLDILNIDFGIIENIDQLGIF